MNIGGRIILASRLLWTGWKLECARKELKNCYQRGEQNDSKRMVRLRNYFNKQCNIWIALENELNDKSEE